MNASSPSHFVPLACLALLGVLVSLSLASNRSAAPPVLSIEEMAAGSLVSNASAPSGSYQQQHFAALPKIAENARVRQEVAAKLIAHGMEQGTCGFHIINPPRHLTTKFSSSELFGDRVGYWQFWPVDPEVPSEHSGVAFGMPIAVLASTQRVVVNGVATLDKYQAAGGWRIDATFSARGMLVIDSVHGPVTSGTEFNDWYGILQPAGGIAAEMTGALVYNGKVFSPFSISALVGLAGPQTVTVAKDLTEATANAVIAAFNGS